MNRSPSALFALSATALLFAAASAQTAQVEWTYNWSRQPVDIISSDVSGTSRISLTDEPLGDADGNSDIVATNLRTFSDAPNTNPNVFTDAGYRLTLRLTDDTSGESGTLNFDGTVSGTLSRNRANISNSFVGPTTGELTLGGNVYSVTIGPYSPPGPPGIQNAGSIAATVTVRPVDDDDTTNTPEPSAMLLSCLGLSVLGMASWRKWRRGGPDLKAA